MSSKGEQTRTEIVEAARNLFYRKGYHHTSFTDIVEEAGVVRGNVYHYFKTKDDLLGAVIAQHLAGYKAMLDTWAKEKTTPLKRLKCFTHMLIVESNSLSQFGCPVGTLGAELGKDSSSKPNPARALLDLFKDWLTCQFFLMGFGGDAEKMGMHLLGRAQGISLLTHVYRDPVWLADEVKQMEAWLNSLSPKSAPAKTTRKNTGVSRRSPSADS
jgi:AcrR family transcriptional regulator